MISLYRVGASAQAVTAAGVEASFGIYLPGINPADGYQVWVRVIHHDDRFEPWISPADFALEPVGGDPSNLWRSDVTIPQRPGTRQGQPGTYLYRFQLLQAPAAGSGNTPRVVTRWFTDPFAWRTDDVGQLSAFVAPGQPPFPWTDQFWKVPELECLVVYELHVEEFNSTFAGVADRLPYLQSLGVTCLELMPVSSLKLDFDWGYGPLHFFAPNERWGGPEGFKALVDACHAAGVAVIVDMVFQHVDVSFPYHLVYSDAGLPSPMIGGMGGFGPEIDYSQDFARSYVQAVTRYWLHEYHVDGFRYDEVADLYDGPVGIKYAKMAFDAYCESLTMARFTPSGGTQPNEYSRIIQCAEALNQPQEVLRSTYSSAVWQDALLNKSEAALTTGAVDDDFAHLLDTRFCGYATEGTVHDVAGSPVQVPVAPFQYLESHDHTQLVAFTGGGDPAGPFADRGRWYKVQPFVIALFTCEGIPMLWQGQEFADNYVLPAGGDARIHFRRDAHWEYFYDDAGGPLVRLHRVLAGLRVSNPALRSRESFYYNLASRPADGLLVYRRQSAGAAQIALVCLNFSDAERQLAVPFETAGTYREMLDQDQRAVPWDVTIATVGEMVNMSVPPNYGLVLIRQ
jgi:1,4-alpha-glucan branching enzyme